MTTTQRNAYEVHYALLVRRYGHGRLGTWLARHDARKAVGA